jgi:hypothetical protein
VINQDRKIFTRIEKYLKGDFKPNDLAIIDSWKDNKKV